ncbi:MAG TPA: ABC transporter ATP-binding protein [Pyrinomonadaceae bacterium]|nr:ABC transporter ATP-binding protein [Pyrinomonadaceae bacterium]
MELDSRHPKTSASKSFSPEVSSFAAPDSASDALPAEVVIARDLTKLYNKHKAVDGIEFSVRRGETFGLLGPNGAGKSTTMRMIACRTPPTSGRLLVEGLDVRTQAREIRGLIGVVPQDNNLDPDLNVLRNLIVYASYYRIAAREAARKAEELLDFIGLGNRADAKIEQLSGGMKRRLMIARALLHNPRVLVLDEPTTGLDPQVRQEIWQKLEELRRVGGVTILLSTHYMEEAEKLCERLVVMDRGHILASGTPRELVLSRVSRYALEVRDVGDLPLQTSGNGINAVARNNAHFYFAAEAETLTPLMKEYEGRRRMIRLSNLEDVFLQLVGDNETESPSEV